MWRTAQLDLAARFADVVKARMLFGFGPSFLFVPISQVAYSYLPAHKNNKASSLTNLFRNQGGSVGIALATTWLDRRTQFHHSVLAEHLSAYNPLYNAQVHIMQGDACLGRSPCAGYRLARFCHAGANAGPAGCAARIPRRLPRADRTNRLRSAADLCDQAMELRRAQCEQRVGTLNHGQNGLHLGMPKERSNLADQAAAHPSDQGTRDTLFSAKPQQALRSVVAAATQDARQAADSREHRFVTRAAAVLLRVTRRSPSRRS